MAIRSAIAVHNPAANSFDTVYCHWDGLPGNQFCILNSDYVTAKKTRRLIAGGDMSALKTEKNWNGSCQKPGPLYYSARGETGCEPRELTETGLIEFAVNTNCEFIYIYFPRLGWSCHPIESLAPHSNELTASIL